MFSLDEYQSRLLDNLETKDWLSSVLKTLGKKNFPTLDENINYLEKNELDAILTDVLKDAEKYNFEDDDELLIRYAIFSVNQKRTPMNTPTLASSIKNSETVLLGIRDQIAIADWTIRSYELFGVR